MPPFESISRRLQRHADERPDAVAFRVVARTVQEITWRELWIQASAVADVLDGGQRIAIACEDTLDFVVALAASFLSGSVAVPTPVTLSRRSAPRTDAVLGTAEPTALVVGAITPDWLGEIAAARNCRLINFDRRATEGNGRSDVATGNQPSDVALIQFSSGSTGDPKGIGLTHGNIVANCQAIAGTYGFSSDTRMVSWLPLHHDMGLIGHVVFPMWMGCRSTLMNALRFLQRPLSWLRLIDEERATITSAPNFAYEMCSKAADTIAIDGLDLSSLSVAICGGEPVLPSTVRRFLKTFAPAGFRASAFAPSYGLAESTLLVSSGMTAEGPRIVDAPVAEHEAAFEVADLGPPVEGLQCRIVDPEGRELPEGETGEIELTGTSVGQILGEPVSQPLRTGDLGFVREGRLHVTGRRKELIILKGQNVYPADVEMAAMNAHPAIVPGGLAAIGVDTNGTQELVVFAELERSARLSETEVAAIERLVGERVSRQVGHVPKEVIALRFGTLPRTPSGKVQRNVVTGLFLSGALGGENRLAARPDKADLLHAE